MVYQTTISQTYAYSTNGLSAKNGIVALNPVVKAIESKHQFV